MALGSILLALVAALVAMFIPTRFKIVYVTSGILVALGIEQPVINRNSPNLYQREPVELFLN